MSYKSNTLEVCYPFSMTERCMEEKEEFRKITCCHCGGNGFATKIIFRNDTEHITCPVCQGMGFLKAEITIKWMPDKKEE